MYLVLFENLGNIWQKARGAVIDRFRELSARGFFSFGSISKSAFLWKLLQRKDYPGDAFFAYLAGGGKLGRRSVALLKPVFIEEGALTEKTGSIEQGVWEIAGRSFFVEKNFLIYQGSTKVRLDEEKLRYIPLEPGAKETAKLLNLFARKVLEKHGLFPKLWGFGKFVRPEKIDAEFFSKDKLVSATLSFMGAKKKSLKEIIPSSAKLKLIHTRNEKELMPLLVRGEFEPIVIMSFPDFFGEVLIYLEGVNRDLTFQVELSKLPEFLDLLLKNPQKF